MSQWKVETTDASAVVQNGNTYLIANGYLGYRGTLEEMTAKDFVAVNLLGVYDQHGDAWREPVNAPDPLHLKLWVNGEQLSEQTEKSAHRQWLDLKAAVHHRQTTFQLGGVAVTITAERFASADDEHLLASQVTLTVDRPAEIVIDHAINCAVWDLNGPHFVKQHAIADGVVVTTGEGDQVAVVAKVMAPAWHATGTQLKVAAEPGVSYRFSTQAVVYTSMDVPATQLVTTVAAGFHSGTYQTWRAEHAQVWAKRWDHSDVQIQGDDQADLALRYSLYQLQSIAPHHLDLSIPARGLSGQTYKGAFFWDTEMFMLPFFLRNDPQVAKRLLTYRINTLPKAQQKARDYGYVGAFYAWESQADGRDATSDYNVTDVFTGRPMRTFFRDKQIHISAAVGMALWSSYQLTGDVSLLVEGGLEVLIECAKFYYSRSYWSPLKHRFELLDVLGPDEYHERVNNNAYTNRAALATVQAALAALPLVQKAAPEVATAVLTKVDWPVWQARLVDYADQLYIPVPDQDGVIPQFDGYRQLENVLVPQVRERLLKPNEYWGGAYGVASDTQVIKQADVVLLLKQFAQDYTVAQKVTNWQYYEPRTEHGSTLSASTYALVACEIGKADWAYPFFMQSATVDLTGKSKQFAGGVYIGGTHPAANGGAWMDVVQGFCGLQEVDGRPTVASHLPSHWQAVHFRVCLRGQWYQAEVTQTTATIQLM